jgi:nitrite reductase (NO-forming)
MKSTYLFKILRRPTSCATLIILVLAVSTFSLLFLGLNVSGAANAAAYAPSRSKSPIDLPSTPSSADRVVVTLVTQELLGQLADGVTYTYWTFNGTVPGPFIRLREGQQVEMHIKNTANSTMTHSIDSHAILGTGGGSVYSQTPPGQESIFLFTAMRAGLYIYHCATPDIPTHIANGMYGLMLVEPKEGLLKVDREFYVVQGEFYTQGPLGEQGHQAFSYQKANAETPEYVVFNGKIGALTGNGTMKAKVGETIRIFFGNAGPNLISSFHVIGGILDKVYSEGCVISDPIRNVQTTVVPAGGAVMVEFKAEVPSRLTLVDHALFRIHRGAVGMISVEGPSSPTIFSSIKNATTQVGDGHMVNMTTMTMTSTTGTPSGQTNPSSNVEVAIENYAYGPTELTVTVGTTVTWTNKDSVGHTVTEGTPESTKPANQRLFDSSNGAQGKYDLMQLGQSWSFTFTTPGTYDYYCIPHPYMRARITVLPAGGSPSQGSQGYGDFTVVLTGKQIYAVSAFGLIVLVALMAIFARAGKKGN